MERNKKEKLKLLFSQSYQSKDLYLYKVLVEMKEGIDENWRFSNLLTSDKETTSSSF